MLKILKRHKRVATVSLLLLCLSFGITLAVMSKPSNSLTNSFTPGSVESEIKEDSIVVKEDKIEKKPYVNNTGKSDALIRARVTISPSELVDKYNIQIEYNSNNWTKDENSDWWYYNNILEPGKTTEPLFTYVTGDGIVSNGQIIKELEGLEIAVYHESVQTSILGDDGNPITANTGKYEGNTQTIWDTISQQNDLLNEEGE